MTETKIMLRSLHTVEYADIVTCVVTISLLVSTSVISNVATLLALMMNFIWFTNKNCFIVPALSRFEGIKTLRTSHESETLPSHNKLCVLVHCFVGICVSQAIYTGIWTWLFWMLLGTAMAQLQHFVISEPDEVCSQSNWQHRLRQTSLLLLHIVSRQHCIKTNKVY